MSYKLSLLVLLFALILLLGCFEPAPLTEDYTHSAEGFSFTCPKDWTFMLRAAQKYCFNDLKGGTELELWESTDSSVLEILSQEIQERKEMWVSGAGFHNLVSHSGETFQKTINSYSVDYFIGDVEDVENAFYIEGGVIYCGSGGGARYTVVSYDEKYKHELFDILESFSCPEIKSGNVVVG